MRLALNSIELILLKSIHYHVRWEDVRKIEFDGIKSAWITTDNGTFYIYWVGEDKVCWPPEAA